MKKFKSFFVALCLLCIAALLVVANVPVNAQNEAPDGFLIIGRLLDEQGQAISEARVRVLQAEQLVAETFSQENGVFSLTINSSSLNSLDISFARHHFQPKSMHLSQTELEATGETSAFVLEDLVLQRKVTPAFWIATGIFLIVLGLIATGKLHTTLSGLLGVSLLYIFSYLEPLFEKGLYVFNFESSLRYVDWNVIFLVMGMMIVIAIVEGTGIFQWLSLKAYQLSKGRMWLLLIILMLFTGIASAFLDNVTTMLLMTPMTVQISIALGISPIALLIPEVMASNVIGVSTLVGTPTNILIGSFGRLSFNDFLSSLTPGVLLSFIGLVIYCWFVFRKDLLKAHKPSPVLMAKLVERGEIAQPDNLKKAAWVGAGMLILFVLGEEIHMLPAVTALIGATALLLWIKPNIEEMIEAIDWTTLVFFISLFIVVGGIQEVGLISIIAEKIGVLVGDSLLLAVVVVIWLSAILSMVIANIPFTAAMLPVIGFLTATIPGAESKVLFYCLSVGSAMGGNGSLIGASANMVMAGIAEAAGYKISYFDFVKKGFPAVLITVLLGMFWLLVKFVL